jgi:hypothetical protein
MEENEETEGASKTPAKKFDLEKIKAFVAEIDWKDRKTQAIIGLCLILILVVVYLAVSGGKKKVDELVDESLEITSVYRPVAYIMLSGADPKDTELRATIKDDEKVMNFSCSLGLEKKSLKIEVLKRMAPMTSEILRFLSVMTKNEVLEMIQDPKGVQRKQLIKRLNFVMQTSGEDALDLKSSGRILQVNFVKFYFPTI